MTTTNIHPTRPLNSGLVSAGKVLLQILVILLAAFLAFIFFVTAHEWGGHVVADMLVFANHGTHIEALEVQVLSSTVKLDAGHWTVSSTPFRFGGVVKYVRPHDPFTLTDWETGFSNLFPAVVTALIALTALTMLNVRKTVGHFPWFAVALVLCVVIFDQILYSFAAPNPEPLVSAVLMGVNSILFKGLVIGLVVLEGWLLIRYVLRYRSSGRAKASPA